MLTTACADVSRIRVNAWSPPVDIDEADDAYVIAANVPGVLPEDVNIGAQKDEVHISGEIHETEGRSSVQRRARNTGSFDYRVTLPGDVDVESCEGDLENGVLRLRLPKRAAATPPADSGAWCLRHTTARR
jgi:HSP20 family protein